jgi:hypothetical protein
MESPEYISSQQCSSNITFKAIKDFVEDLVAVFGTGGGKTPLGLYSRLISHVEGKDSIQGVDKYLSGFKAFFSEFSSNLEDTNTLQTLPRDTHIKYGESDRVYLEIQKYVYQSRSKPDQLETIRRHLLTIKASINKDENALVALEKSPVLDIANIDDPETLFVQDQIERIKKAFENTNIDKSNPMSVVMALASSGIIQNMIAGLQNSNFDLEKMLTGLNKTLAELMGIDDGDDKFDLKGFTTIIQQMMGQQAAVNDVEEVD